MYNILPEDHQKDLIKEYRLRVATVTLFLLSGIFICGFLSLVPAITLTYLKYSSYKQELSFIKDGLKKDGSKDYANTIQNVNDQVKILSSVDQEHVPHKIFDSIVMGRPDGIKITRFTYEVVGTSTPVSLEGTASQLDKLLKFQDNMQKTEPFSRAEFPIDLLSKPKNNQIRFTMQLK